MVVAASFQSHSYDDADILVNYRECLIGFSACVFDRNPAPRLFWPLREGGSKLKVSNITLLDAAPWAALQSGRSLK
jgi:hypothetical protein